MWNKPWRFAEGAAIGAGLVIVGMILQLSIGPINWQMLSAPLNLILLVAFLLALGVLCFLRKRLYIVSWTLTLHAAAPALVFGVALTLVMGLSGWDEMLSAWPFVLIYIWLMIIVGLVTIDRAMRLLTGKNVRLSRFATFTSLLNHAGLFMAMVCGTLGNADMQRLHMTVKVGNPEWRAVEADNHAKMHELPIAIELHSFSIDEYPPQYTVIDNETGQVLKEAPWQIVEDTLYDYAAPRPQSEEYVISLERPPLRTMGETRLWYSFFMPVAGLITWSRWRYRWILGFSALMALVFVCVNLFKPEIHSTTLMPALQSPWFAPHVIVYMFCYALFGAATCVALFLLVKKKNSLSQTEGNDSAMALVDNLVSVGLSFMTIGMLFGALWAKEAWGTYWSWDPKETWAAITWLCYLVYIHCRLHKQSSARKKFCLSFLIFSFICLQMCWWGINYLPSAQGKSIHTYNMK